MGELRYTVAHSLRLKVHWLEYFTNLQLLQEVKKIIYLVIRNYCSERNTVIQSRAIVNPVHKIIKGGN